MPQNHRDATYVQMGMAALLPGMQHMLELMQAELDRMRQTLEQLQSGEVPEKKDGRGSTYWAKMTPIQRSIEMKKRYADRVAKAEANGKPGKKPIIPSGGWEKFKTQAARSREMKRRMKQPHGTIAEKARKGVRDYWAKMTAEQRSAEMLRRRALRKQGAAA